ncbi:hypothetical protein ACLOJK_031588 [Asimina triloba]
MWRSSFFLSRTLSALRNPRTTPRFIAPSPFLRPYLPFCSSSHESPPPPAGEGTPAAAGNSNGEDSISSSEAKKLLRLVNVEDLKRKLGMDGGEVIGYPDLLRECESMGVARSSEEAAAFARVLDEAGVVLLFRDKVYLHPEKVVELLRKALPLELTPENDPSRGELNELLKRKEELDTMAHRHVRRILWSGLGFLVIQVSLFFRLTFWEFSWDVMEPITFFTTMTGIVVGYTYFLLTSGDPTYQDLTNRLYSSRRNRLYKKKNFDIQRFMDLQKRTKCPLEHFRGKV